MWDDLAKWLHVSRDFAKREAYCVMYGGELDPWLTYLIKEGIKQRVRDDYIRNYLIPLPPFPWRIV